MMCRNEILEKYVTKAIKIKDSAIYCDEHTQHAHGKKQDLIDTESRDVFQVVRQA